MKKIIAAVNADHFTADMLVHFNAITAPMDAKLSVVFLENVMGAVLPLSGIFPQEAYPYLAEMDWKKVEENRKANRERVAMFKRACDNHNIDALLYESEGTPIDEIVKQSRYSDLLLIHNNLTFTQFPESDPPEFVMNVLRSAQCPILVLPAEERSINELVFTYNGGFSSMYAIRQFTGLFEHLSALKVTVLFVDENNIGKVPEEDFLKQYLDLHFANNEIKLLQGNAAFEIMNYLMYRPGCLVTFGAYGRSKFSQFFHHSNAEKTLHAFNRYDFITHP